MSNSTNNPLKPTYLLEEGMTIKDKWKILNFIAKGGKGEVYLAQQLNLDRKVALKIMSQEFIQSLEGAEEEMDSETRRFQREVQVMARMQHPNILQVYDFDQLKMNGIEMDYIVMEYIPGPTLRQRMIMVGPNSISMAGLGSRVTRMPILSVSSGKPFPVSGLEQF